jgi:ZipA, C-terminal FtsZ-binding domain
MTDFQLYLIGAGGVFVVGVFAFNKWQEYKARKSVDKAFSNGHDDVLMRFGDVGDISPAMRNEPSLSGSELGHFAATEPLSASSLISQSDDLDEPELVAKPVLQRAHKPEKILPVDELIDCVVALEFDTPMRGEKILSEISRLKYIGKKPVHFVGLDADGERDVIAHGGAYTAIFAGIQLVSRSGPLNELEYSEFITKLRQIADSLNAHPDVPDMNYVMSTARELHQFVSEHDAQLSLNVIANGAPWAINTLLAALEKQGFDLRPDGRLVMPDGDGGVLFSLSTNVSVSATTTSRLSLLLDVPCVSPSRDAFGALSACARSLATRLGGAVVDDTDQPILKPALDEILAQVQEFYGAMEEAQIPAGSVRAQRLFS